jgi:hypothetical protein
MKLPVGCALLLCLTASAFSRADTFEANEIRLSSQTQITDGPLKTLRENARN